MRLGLVAHGEISSGKKSVFQEFSRLTGKFLYIFSCSSDTTPHVIGKILTGMITSGVFCLFDKLHTQSALNLTHLVQSMYTLREYITGRESSSLFFLGRTIHLPSVLTFGCFGTFTTGDNPSPENHKNLEYLKLQMRAAPIKPAFKMLAQGILAGYRFSSFEVLGEKLGLFLKMAKEQMSLQPHYDFSIRSLMIVLKIIYQSKPKYPDYSEEEHIKGSLSCHYIPNLLLEDTFVFKILMEKIFGNTSSFESSALKSHALVHTTEEKVSQLLNAIRGGSHCMVLGESSTGKSQIIKRAAQLYGAKSIILNPEASTSRLFYGHHGNICFMRD